MRFEIITLFPETFEGFLKSSLINKAIKANLISVHLHHLRDFTQGRHRQADDRPYGGGPGMVLMAEPIYQALKITDKTCPLPKVKPVKYLLSPKGQPLTPALAKTLSQKNQIVLLAGHYEGIDERVMPYLDGALSIGDYITMGGEVAAMVVIEAVSRFIPGVLHDEESVQEESFSILHPQKGRLLEWPQYTRPKIWRNRKVPQVLLGGNHRKILDWRLSQAASTTLKNRKDLLE